MLQELLATVFATIIAIGLGISLFAGSTRDKLTIGVVTTMIVTGITASAITWTYLQDNSPAKLVVRNILTYTFLATVFSKLITRWVNAVTNIPEKELQKIGIEYIRKKVGIGNENVNDYESVTRGDDTPDDSMVE